jgi:aldehyde dehydrogenase (NAD+)
VAFERVEQLPQAANPEGGVEGERMGQDVWREERLCIGGALVAAEGSATFDDVNPADEEVLGVAADGSAADMDRAIAAARQAFDDEAGCWTIDAAFRVRCLRQLLDALERHREELRATVIAEVGAPAFLTRGAQLEWPLEGLAWVAELAERYEWVEDLGEAAPYGIRSHRQVHHEPVGVVGAITPWNFPVQINLAKVGPALAAGNTVVLKPAPDTPWTGSLLGRLAVEETDLPPGVLNVVTSSRHEVGQQLAEDRRVDLVSFTGSTATGRRVMAAAAGNLKKVFLELGGKSATLVLDDADIAACAGAAGFQIMTHAGQGCAITSRLVLPRERFDEGVEAVVETMRTIPYGDPTEQANIMGPVISARQRERVLGYVATGIAEGATVALGGGRPEHLERGYFVEPTVLVDVEPGDTVAQQEIFGPVLVVLPHDGDDDAVAIANHSVYGLSGAVFSGSEDRAAAVAARLRTGTVAVNGALWYGPEVPFGGYKQSGIGREMGRQGFEEYLETKAVARPGAR